MFRSLSLFLFSSFDFNMVSESCSSLVPQRLPTHSCSSPLHLSSNHSSLLLASIYHWWSSFATILHVPIHVMLDLLYILSNHLWSCFNSRAYITNSMSLQASTLRLRAGRVLEYYHKYADHGLVEYHGQLWFVMP